MGRSLPKNPGVGAADGEALGAVEAVGAGVGRTGAASGTCACKLTKKKQENRK